MDSVSQSTEGTQDGNNKNVESKTDEQNDNITTQEIVQSSEPTNDCPIKNSTTSDTSPTTTTTSATKTSSSTASAAVVESTPNKSSDPLSSNVDECSSKGTNNNTFISDTSQDQTSQSKTEADTKPPQPHVIPEVTLIGKFEIAPISTSSSSSSSSSSSLKLECLQTTTATITTTAAATSSISFNSSSRSHSKENEKFGTTTFEVNKVRDDSLKIATKAPTQTTALGGIFSSTSSQQSSSTQLSRGETDATTTTTTAVATAAAATTSSSAAAAMCNRVSSENESINQNVNQNRSSSSNQEIIESSSNNSNTTSSTTDDDNNKHSNYVKRETCIENRIQNTDCNLEKDFILDSKKLSKDISVEQKIDECSNGRAAVGCGGGGQQPSTNNNNNNINNSNKNIDDENSEKIKINSAGAENKSSSCNYFFNEALGKSDSNTTTTTTTTTTDLSNIIKPIKNTDKMECDTGCKNITENIENNIIIDRIDKNILSYKKFSDKILNKTNVEHHVMTSSSDMSSSSRQLNSATTTTKTIITKAANAGLATATATAATTTNVSDNEITTNNNAREDKKFTSNNAQSMNDDNNVVSSSNISNNNFDTQLTNFDDINNIRKLDDNVPESTISRCIPNETSQEMNRNKSININNNNNNNRMECLSSLTGQTSSSNYQEINSRLSHPNIQIQSLPQVRSSPIEQIGNKEASSSSSSSISAATASFRNQAKIETYPQTSKEMVASKIRHYYDQKFSPVAVSSNSSDRSNIITKNDKNTVSDTTTTTTQKVAQQQPVINSYYDCNREATQSTTYDRSHQYYHQQQQQQHQQSATTTNNNRTPLRESESTVVSSNQQYNPHYYNREANTVTQQPENNRYNSWQASERQIGYQNQQQQHSQDVSNYLNQSRSTLTNNYSNTMSKQQITPTNAKLQDNIKNLPTQQQLPSQSELLLTNNNNKTRNSTTSVSAAAGNNNQQYFQQYPRSTTTDTYQIKEMEYQRQMAYNHNYNYNLNQPQQRSTITTSSSSSNQSTTNQQQQQQQQTNQHNNSLYINNPDFSKQISQKSRIPSSSSSVNNNNINNNNNSNNNNNDLSQLHMKPPDFSKISSTDKVSSPQNVYPRSIKNDYPKQNIPQITQQNFAELSKKYNYISDLQLKNPVPPDASKQPYNNLYVKAPDFSTENFQNKVSSEAKNLQIKQQQIPQSQQQLLQQQQQQQQFGQRTSEAASVRNESSYARQFPQLSHDVELSVVPPKPTSSYPDNTKNPYERQMSYADYLQYNKSGAHTVVEPQNKSVDRNLKTVPAPEQQPKPDPYYQTRNEYQQTAYPAQVTSREQYQQLPGQQMYGSNLKIQQPNEMNAAQGYASIRYEQKTQQQQQQQQQPTHPAEPYSSYNYQQVSSSVIQSSKPRDRYPEYSPPASQNQIKPNESPLTSMQRQIPNNLNYHVPQQAAPSHMTSNQASKIPSPSPMTHSRGGYPAQNQSNSNPPSPACQSTATYKTTPSPGTMNPPYGWPSQTNGSRISQSPLASPHAPYRITSQSPSALNAVSPQSPTFLQPSPKASPSPTLLSRPTPQAAQNMHVNYKTPYGHPGSSPYYQPNEHAMRVPNNYGPKIEKPVEKVQPAEAPVTHYRNVDTRQTEYANAAAYQQKSSTSKRNYVDYSPNPRKVEQPKSTSKYPEISPPKQDYPVLFGKSPSESNLSKSHQKPNYREMINHVHAIRSATSETDLNVEIIKRTLKKDISARRSDSDLSKSIFDSPVPTKNCGYYARSTECIPGLRPQYEETKRMDPSTAGFDASRRQSQPDLLKARVPERKPSLPLCNDLARNDISVTVSKVIRSTSAERQKVPDRPTQSIPETYPQHSEFSSVVISKVNYNHAVEQQQMPPSHRSVEARPVPQQTVIETNKPSSSVFNPVKRESPLDLSVKTVKTKADSTGCDDVNSYHARNHPSSSALKVDFSPNFSKHSSGEASTRTSQHPTQAASFDSRYPNTVQHVQQPQTQRYTSVSQSRPFQPPAHQMPPATQQYLQHAPYHAGSPHHQVSPQSHIQPSPSARPDATYPAPILPREPSSYGYEHHVSQPHTVHLEHRSTRPQEYVQPPQATKPKYEYPPKPQEEAGYQPPLVGANIFGQSSKQNTYVNPYLPQKREPEAAKQNVILNPPTPMTVYDKKSDDYLMNTPQRQRKISDKAKEPEPLKIPNPAETHKIQQYSTRQDSVLRYDAYDSRKKPESAPIPNPSQSNAVNQRLASSNTVKTLPDANINYNRPGYGVNDRIRDEFSRPIEVQKRNETSFIPDSYGHYVNTTLESRKVAQPMNKINQTYERIEPDKHRNSEYHRKRPPEVTPPSSKDYQPAEKQVRVDELYRAHLEEKYRQHQQFTQKVNVPQPLERRDVSVIHTKIEAIGKNDPKSQEQYPYAYKENYQQHPVHNSVNYQAYSQQQQTWRPPGHVKPIPSPHEATKTVQRELYPHHQQHYLGPQKSEIERLKSLEAKKQAAIPAEATPKILPTSTQTQPPPVNRGADQNVISKLRNSIEMREYEKQRTSLLRKQANGELGEDEAGKPDIASLLAARIRTKGELKGFTPLPVPAAPEIKEPEKEAPREIPESTERGADLFSDADGNSPFDLLDWGSACNDFVEQLLTGGSKKRGKKRRATKTAPDPQEASRDKSPENFPGVEYNCDIDKSIVEQLKSEISENAVNAANAKKQEQEQAKNRDCSSSDEDKPLLLLRQQSQSDTVPPLTSDADRSVQPVSESKRENSDTSLNSKSNRSTIVEKLSEKVVRNIREKQRLEQERRLAARLSKTSSSESEDDSKRTLYRPKKLTKKPRSRASGASNRELSDTDSSENRSMTRNLFRSRIESRPHKRIENFFTDSDSSTNLNEHAKKLERDDIQKIVNSLGPDSPIPTKREMITKAKVKCMKLPTESSESSDDEKVLVKSIPVKSTKEESKRTPEKATSAQKDGSDGEDASMDQEKTTPSPNKARNKRTASTRQSQDSKIEETMTRSKRKKRLEQQIANGKVLRNEKIIQNTSFDRKSTKPAEKTSSKHSKTSESTAKSADEKTKLLVARIKIDKIDDPKRKHSGNDSDDKRKKQAKFVKDESSDNNSSDSEKETVSDRLRSRRSRLSNERHDTETVTKSTKKHKSKEKPKEEFEIKKASSTSKSTSTKKSKSKPQTTETNTEKFPPGWELEVYQYKRALKIPPSLISIKGPIHHRVSTSLPDLDPHSSDTSETFQGDSTKKTPVKSDATDAGKPPTSSTKASKKSKQTKESEVECKTIEKLSEVSVPKSIIDVLHSRLKSKKVKNKNSRFASHNEPKLIPRGSNEAELLATPGKDDKPPFEEHHNVFHTEVLKSRTRTEYRILKNKELIREVFGGEDRPASAPPEIRDEVENDTKVEQITFVEKYDKYLQEMNVDFGEKIRKNRKPPNEDNKISSDPMAITIKTEKPDEEPMFPVDEETQDNEIKACLQTIIKEETQDTNERDTPSIISERDGVVTPLIFKRKKCNKYRGGRRKGSSGFDYIRKKKKPQTNTNNSQDIIKRKKNSPIEFFNSRDESDVSKEIQKWVLNKSVGQSALHKAARLGYLDVIAYCLERLGMNPDAKDNAGYTPLHEACAKGRIDIARVLLQYGANHSETAHSGIRPLHEASENGYIEVVRLLLSYGADPLLTTYSGQTPLMLAENAEMEQFIKNHLQDVQNTGPHKQPWKFPGPWKILDPDDYGYDVLSNTPETDDDDQEDNYSYSCSKSITSNNITDKSRSNEKCDTNSNIMHHDDKTTTKSLQNPDIVDNIKYKTKGKQFSAKCTVLLDNIGSIDHINSVKQFKNAQSKGIARRRSTFERKDSKAGRYLEESDGDGEIFEFEESDMPLPPLYLLKDEGTDKWVLLNDLCNLLKVKSKDTLLKQLCPSIPPSTVNKELLRELKMSDFLEKATCLQLLCAGEKLNVRSSKVVLVKYNESVKNLLGVKTIVMKF